MKSFKCGLYKPRDEEQLKTSMEILTSVEQWFDRVEIIWVNKEQREHYIHIEISNEGFIGMKLAHPKILEHVRRYEIL